MCTALLNTPLHLTLHKPLRRQAGHVRPLQLPVRNRRGWNGPSIMSLKMLQIVVRTARRSYEGFCFSRSRRRTDEGEAAAQLQIDECRRRKQEAAGGQLCAAENNLPHRRRAGLRLGRLHQQIQLNDCPLRRYGENLSQWLGKSVLGERSGTAIMGVKRKISWSISVSETFKSEIMRSPSDPALLMHD